MFYKGFVVPIAGVEVRSTGANTDGAQTAGRAIYTILFAQPHIKVSTAAWVGYSGEDKAKLWV